jgi:hypothetical protein
MGKYINAEVIPLVRVFVFLQSVIYRTPLEIKTKSTETNLQCGHRIMFLYITR